MQTHTTKKTKESARKDPETLRFGRMASLMIKALPLGVVAFDRNLTITDSNPAALAILPPDQTNIAHALALGTTDQSPDHWTDQLHSTLAGSDTRTFENISYNRNGRNYILRILCTPLGKENIGGTMLIEDITALVAMENDLASAERLAALGKLAAHIAHELNNPLDGIMRYLNLALRLTEQQGPEQVSHYLQEARGGLLRMVQILSELLEYSRNTYSACEDANVNKIVEDAIKTMDGQAHEARVEIVRNFAPDMPNVRSGNLCQVFSNLIKNAIDAMEDTGGELQITTSSDPHAAVVRFADEGAGLSDEVMQKMFDPFFTTKEVGKGTGLGLAICKDIIERCGGTITAENQPQRGSLMSVTIPTRPPIPPQKKNQ